MPTVRRADDFQLLVDPAGDAAAKRRQALAALIGGRDSGELTASVAAIATEAVRSADQLRNALQRYQPRAKYPETSLGRDLQLLAQLSIAGFGTRLFHLGFGSFDTHARQLDTHAGLLQQRCGEVGGLHPRCRRPRPQVAERVSVLAMAHEIDAGRRGRVDTHAAGVHVLGRPELEQHPKPLRAGRLHFESGRLLESPLSEMKEAAEHYLKAHALLGDHLPSIRGARRTLLALGRAQEAVQLFDAELKLTAEAAHKAQLLYDKAAVQEDLLGQRKEAREALDASADLGRGDATRIKAIERAEALARGWDNLGRAYEREAEWRGLQLSGDPQAAIGLQQGLVERALGVPDTPEGIQVWFGSHPTALQRIGLALRAEQQD